MANESDRPDPKMERRKFLSVGAAAGGAAALAPGTGPSLSRRRSLDPFLGEIMMIPFNFAPRGWAFCEGQTLPINPNQSLFSLIGTYYGGDGRTTFQLPDTRPLEAQNARRSRSNIQSLRYVIAIDGVYPSRP